MPVRIAKAAHCYKIDAENLKSAGKERAITEARRVLCYIAVRKLGSKCNEVSKAMGISAVTVSKAVSLGSELSEVDKIQKQMLDNEFPVITPQKNQTGEIEKYNGRPPYSLFRKAAAPYSRC